MALGELLSVCFSEIFLLADLSLPQCILSVPISVQKALSHSSLNQLMSCSPLPRVCFGISLPVLYELCVRPLTSQRSR